MESPDRGGQQASIRAKPAPLKTVTRPNTSLTCQKTVQANQNYQPPNRQPEFEIDFCCFVGGGSFQTAFDSRAFYFHPRFSYQRA